MRESKLMVLHYLTASVAIVAVGFHVSLHFLLTPFAPSIEYSTVVTSVRNTLYATTLELVLIAVSVHGFNGLRIILLEWKQGSLWEKGVALLTAIAAIAVVGIGTRTLLVLNGLM